MNRVFWLANPYSPHVRHWYEIYNELDGNNKLTVFHINHHKAVLDSYFSKDVHIISPFSWMNSLPSFLQYLLLGIWLRFKLDDNDILHAHNTSGYGLAAFLSGKPYIITTYGSEIYSVDNKPKLYCYMIKKIINKASLITSASSAMTNKLNEISTEVSNKIFQFSLGISNSFSYSKESAKCIRDKLLIPNTAKVFISNRRMTPLYRIKDIVDAFEKLQKTSLIEELDLHLVLLVGDSDIEYKNTLLSSIVNEKIHVIDEFLSQKELTKYLSAADYIISIPKSDQLSSSILEGVACGCIPILSKLEAYSELDGCVFYVSDSNFNENLVKQMKECVMMDEISLNVLINKGKNLIFNYSMKKVSMDYNKIILYIKSEL